MHCDITGERRSSEAKCGRLWVATFDRREVTCAYALREKSSRGMARFKIVKASIEAWVWKGLERGGYQTNAIGSLVWGLVLRLYPHSDAKA